MRKSHYPYLSILTPLSAIPRCRAYAGASIIWDGVLLHRYYGLMNEPRSQEMLLNRTSPPLSSLLRGLDGIDLETIKRIMESCGEAYARSDGDLGIAERIAAETRDEAELFRRSIMRYLGEGHGYVMETDTRALITSKGDESHANGHSRDTR